MKSTGEYYHIYNRGTDKRDIFANKDDLTRFLLSMREFNSTETFGSIRDTPLESKTVGRPLVECIAHGINQNHYHFILRQVEEKGIQKFMQRLGVGYTMYFNEKYKRSGVLFQGGYKSRHISSNEYLLHASVYVNLNSRIHYGDNADSKIWASSWDEYLGKTDTEICKKDIILGQFRTREDYKKYAEDALPEILRRKEGEKELRRLLLE